MRIGAKSSESLCCRRIHCSMLTIKIVPATHYSYITTAFIKQVGRKRKAVAKDDSEDEEWSPVKRKRVAKATTAKPRRTSARKKS